MKIGLYFGSFNPIHIGHLIIASHIADNTLIRTGMVCNISSKSIKKRNSLLNEHHRKHLIDLSIEGEKKLRTSNVEFKLPGLLIQ